MTAIFLGLLLWFLCGLLSLLLDARWSEWTDRFHPAKGLALGPLGLFLVVLFRYVDSERRFWVRIQDALHSYGQRHNEAQRR